MPYQDRHEGETDDGDAMARAPVRSPDMAKNGRTIQIIIVVGLVAAVTIAIFGSY